MDKYLSENILNKYEFKNYGHALEILTQAFPHEWKDVLNLLEKFSISIDDLTASGGSGTNILASIDDLLYPRKWRNVKIEGDLHIKFYDRIIDQRQYEDRPASESIITNYIGSHRVDYLKGRVAIGFEWNKKDLDFDRVLADMRAFYECNLISAGIIITRSGTLSDAFRKITDSEGKPILRKYGASTTWLGRLIPKLDGRENGGCPILAIGIMENCIEGVEDL